MIQNFLAFSLEESLSLLIASDGAVDERICGTLSVITATFTGPRQTSLFQKATRPAAPCATYCYHARQNDSGFEHG